jgi:hypothetical protein
MVSHAEVAMHLPPSEAAAVEPRSTWQSCCFECDREVVLYFTKTAITVSILVFAMFRIASNTDPCKDQAFENSLIGLIAGSFIEQGSQRMMKK